MSELDFEAGLPAPTTERRSPLEQAQRALGWAGLKFDILQALFRLSVEWLEEEPLLVEALRILEDHLGAEAGSVIMLDRQEGDLYFAAATGPVSERIKEYRLDRGEGIAGWCMEMGEVVRISNVAADERWHAEISQRMRFDVRQIIAAPIRVRNRVVGCVELINRTGGVDEFEPEDEEIMAAAAEGIGLLFTLRGRRPAQ